ncbi:DUF6541 family protein [Cellulosimicrobium sp. NPDC057127]|uniref:DUF6541 family protein n=1 Tax=Cellulosimicrobium sp. NPDC057127 TaxID=3346026 RepID=UPI00362FAFB9
MSWWSVGDELALAVVVLFGPGLLVGWALGLRRVWVVATAPALSLATLGAGAVLLELLGIGWSRLSAALCTVLVAALATALRLVLRRWWAPDRVGTPGALATAVGLVVSAPLAALPIKRGMIDPGMPAQTWDTPFHVNALRWILETGDGSTLHLGAVSTNPETFRFYPAGWHDVVSLVVTDSIPAAINVTAIVIAALVWPLGLACLVAVIVPSSRTAPIVAMCVGAGFVAFPARMQSVGTLWPNALAFALLPVALALTVRLTGMRASVRSDADAGSRWPVVTGLVAALGGIAVCHPNGVLAYLVLSAALWLATWWRAARRFREASSAVRSVVVALPVLAVVGGVVLALSPLVRSVSSYERDRLEGRSEGALSVITDSQLSTVLYGNGDQAWWIAALLGVGAVTAFALRRGRWLVTSVVLVTALYTLTVDPSARLGWLVGPWYSDPLRLGGMAVVAMAPLAATGVVGFGVLVGRLLARRRPAAERAVTVVPEAVTVGVLALLMVLSGWMRADTRQWMYDLYYAAPDVRFGLVTADELAMLQRLDDELPEDAVVLGTPFSGAPFVYGIGERDVVFPHLTGSWGPDLQVLAEDLDRAGADPEVCAALERVGVTHLYVDSAPYWPENENQARYEALLERPEDLGLGLRPVDQGGTAQVFEITSCG